MSLATSNRDGGRTSESGHLRSLMKAFKGQVLSGLNVTQRGAGANMSVDVQIGDTMIPRSDLTYGHPAWNDAVYNQVIAVADVSNPRRDIIVMYIDYGQAPSTGVSNNTNGVVKIKSVAGTPAGSPSDPTDVAIQASVGSGNPFVKLARVRVAAGASSITNSVIDDLRLMARFLQQNDFVYDDLFTWVYASATTFTIAGVDARDQFPIGTRIALYQSGAIKYFKVTGNAFSTNTTITVDGGGTYSLTNVPIDRPAFSHALTPSNGFPRQILSDPLAGFVELARGSVAAASTITLSNLPPHRYLQLLITINLTATILPALQFNGDTGANYSDDYNQYDGNAAGTDVNQTFAPIYGKASGSGDQMILRVDINNPALMRKYQMSEAYLAGPPASGGGLMQGIRAKWTNNAASINAIRLFSRNGNNFGNLEVIVLGKD